MNTGLDGVSKNTKVLCRGEAGVEIAQGRGEFRAVKVIIRNIDINQGPERGPEDPRIA